MSACRLCGAQLHRDFVDLGASPIANEFLSEADLAREEVHYPLRVFVCEGCFLVQLPDVAGPERIFSPAYAYFSSFSDTWLAHAEAYADAMTASRGLGDDSLVVEVASNDGYLLQYFAKRGVRVLGIEPTANTAEAALAKGIETRVAFFGRSLAGELASEGVCADLVVANNVLAHVPDLHDFVGGFPLVLAPDGVATFEFPHLLRLIERSEFDTIYHEHLSYLSLVVVERLFAEHGLAVADVEQLDTHGGSLRVHAVHADAGVEEVERVEEVRQLERAAGLHNASAAAYGGLAGTAERVKLQLLEFLLQAKRDGKLVVGYGAPAKGNTLLNYCGVRPDLLPFTVDRNPRKQGCYLPGTRIPVFAPDRIFEEKPDYVLVLPWNIRDEIEEQLAGVREWGGRFVVPIPELALS
jgi:SAM-dependent methyltransferase